MAPTNEYLEDAATRQALVDHDPHIVKKTTIEFAGEAPEIHWDFDRPTEYERLNSFLDGFAEPDFQGGKVTLSGALQHVFGTTAADGYLVNRTAGMLKPSSTFNRNFGVDGLVYVVNAQGAIVRLPRRELAFREFDARAEAAEAALARSADYHHRGMAAAGKRGFRIDPDSKAELEAHAAERVAAIGERTLHALEAGAE